jgi:hypothetical protein
LPAPASSYDPVLAEEIVMRMIGEAIRDRRECPTNDDFSHAIGCALGSATTPTILHRLEAKGLIAVKRYQRSRQVIDIRTGKSTAAPANTAPHWRDRKKRDNVPTPALGAMRVRNAEMTARIMVAARREGRDLIDFLGDLVWMGFHVYEEECDG